ILRGTRFKVARERRRRPLCVALPDNVMDEGAEVEIAPSTTVDTRARPDPAVVERIEQLLLDATSPVIICGDGVAESGGQAELIQLAETIGARVHAAFSAELAFPSLHPLYAGLLNVISAAGLKGQLSAADVGLAVGTPVPPLLFPIEGSPFA